MSPQSTSDDGVVLYGAVAVALGTPPDGAADGQAVADWFVATITMLAPVVLLAVRGKLPRWLCILLAVALIEQLIETVTIYGQSGFTAPGGPMNIALGAG